MTKRCSLPALLAGALSLWPLLAAHGALLIVDTTADDLALNGNCTLREAIWAANTNQTIDGCARGDSTATDTILIGVSGTLNATLGVMTVTERLTIAGLSADSLEIVGSGRIFNIDLATATHDFELQSVTLRGGAAGSGNGGAVQLVNVDRATFSGVHFVDNQAADGGAIGGSDAVDDTQNELRVQNCLFRGNHATDRGGAIGFEPKTGEVLRNLTVLITRTSFQFNSADDKGGAVALALANTASATINRSAFIRNTAEAGGAGGLLLISGGGADGTPNTIENSTFAGNRSSPSGGAIEAYFAELRIVSSTFHLNSSESGAAHLWWIKYAGQLFEVGHTIFGANLDGVGCAGIPTSLGYNVFADGTCGGANPNDLASVDPQLSGISGIVSDATVLLPSAHSVAIDSGDLAGCPDVGGGTLLVDQRGVARPLDGDDDALAVCDRGAAEVPDAWSGLFADGFELGSYWAWSSYTL